MSIHHDRLVVGTFPTNMGTPNTQQAMILGSPFPHYAPHGADDYIERTHIASLMALRRPVAGSSRIWYHQAGKVTLMRSSRTYIEFGVFETRVLRAIGGYAPHEPCGQDSVVISLALHMSRVGLTTTPTYHKLHREDSLTHHPATRGGSPLRTGVRLRNREVLNRCAAIGWKRTDAIRAYRESLVPASVKSVLEDRAALVETWLR